ncbi:Ig-like domain-containing protein [Tropicibacter alexandrii]|uniref:Ig-like domain-containing protein n=1 Tax=Tropicibacter alexandrii TaxID=2267683 RepID=UPI000EF462E6|nr:Ig-like domain-containing protein [Tropicibacter alexandrii]
MGAIEFVIRTRAGAIERGSVGGGDEDFLIDAGTGNDISLNIRQADLRGYDRSGNDLLVTLADGRVIVLEGYFEVGADGGNRLFLSSDGILNEVSFVQTDNGALFAQYGPTETWGKWSPSDQLIFIDDPQVVADAPLNAYDGEEEEVTMLGTALLGGLAGTGAGVGAAALGGAALIGAGLTGGGGGNGGGGGGGGTTWVTPTVDDPDAVHTISGNDTPSLTITGTANPGSTVVVIIGGETVTVISDGNGIWEATFDGDDFPDDGLYPNVNVEVTDPDGTVTGLVGPSFEIDTIGPIIDVTHGTVSAGDLFNAVSHAGGVTLSGTGEAGATLIIEIDGHTETLVIDNSGSWSATFDATVLPGGEYTSVVTLTATDAFGNTTVVTDSVEIDTIPHPITIDPVTADNIISGAEANAGFLISGTSTAGAIVTVSFETFSQDVLVAADGTWEVTVTAADFPGGEYSSDITVTTTDLAGNGSSAVWTVDIDTVNTLTLDNGPLTGDDLINATELAGGVTLTGMSQAGASVAITIEGITQTVTADATGAWSTTFTGLSGGTYQTSAQIVSTDAVGNTETLPHSFTIDTENAVTIDTSAVAGDGVVNATEQGGMVTVTGTGEAGATLVIENALGSTWTTTVAADGSWSLQVPGSALAIDGAEHSYLGGTAPLYVTSTDAAGNISYSQGTVQVDTRTELVTLIQDADGVINAAERDAGVDVMGFGEPGSSIELTVSGQVLTTTVDAGGSWSVTIPTALVPTGQTSMDISVTATDPVGNVLTQDLNIPVDTATTVQVSTANVETDGVVNAVERADGVTLVGSTEPGNSVNVTMGGVTRPATVAADGSWTVTYSAAAIPQGETQVTVTAVATDAAGNTATATDTLDVDTLVRNFGITSTPGGADGIVNAAEAQAGMTVTGTTEPGGTVVLTLAGQTVQAVVDSNGNWTATFTESQLPSGETTATLTALSTDAAGNTSTVTQTVRVDTDAGLLTISPNPVEGDDVVNFAEASDGVVLYGTSNPGQMVTVTLGGVSHVVQTDAAGNWTAPFSAGEITPGTYTAQITATITDSAGNTLTRTDSVLVDTEVVNFATSANPVEGDNVINATEAADGFVLTGTTEPGSTVSVTFEGTTVQASVDANGNWSASFAASSVPAGEYSTGATIDTIDPAGNTATTSVTFGVDTLVNDLTGNAPTLTGDGTINALEAANGATLTGTVEPGSTVEVTFGGMVYVATVEANGSWSLDIPSDGIPRGTLTEPMLIEATDAAGNVRVINDSVQIDTDAPDSLNWLGYGRDGSGVDMIRTEMTDDAVYLGRLTNTGGAADIVDVDLSSSVDIGAIQQTWMSFDSAVPDGTHLVLATTDDAGNTTGTYLVTDDPHTNTVQMSDGIANALTEFQIDTIDLHFAEDADLTITEAQILALSETTDTVIIKGGSDDEVTIATAQLTGSETIDGEVYSEYTMGGATLLIDDEITVHNFTV